MHIRPYRESDRDRLKEITIQCFSGSSSIDHNLDRLFGEVGGKDWAMRIE